VVAQPRYLHLLFIFIYVTAPPACGALNLAASYQSPPSPDNKP